MNNFIKRIIFLLILTLNFANCFGMDLENTIENPLFEQIKPIELLNPKDFTIFQSNYTQLNKLILWGSNNNNFYNQIKNLNFLKNCTNLEKIEISNCYDLENLSGLENCLNLQKITINECSKLKDIKALFYCKKLCKIKISYSPNIAKEQLELLKRYFPDKEIIFLGL